MNVPVSMVPLVAFVLVVGSSEVEKKFFFKENDKAPPPPSPPFTQQRARALIPAASELAKKNPVKGDELHFKGSLALGGSGGFLSCWRKELSPSPLLGNLQSPSSCKQTLMCTTREDEEGDKSRTGVGRASAAKAVVEGGIWRGLWAASQGGSLPIQQRDTTIPSNPPVLIL